MGLSLQDLRTDGLLHELGTNLGRKRLGHRPQHRQLLPQIFDRQICDAALECRSE